MLRIYFKAIHKKHFFSQNENCLGGIKGCPVIISIMIIELIIRDHDKGEIRIINPCPADPGYTLPLQTV